MRGRLAMVVVGTWLAFARLSPAAGADKEAPSPAPAPEGTVAPDGCWTVEDGALGRTGVAATPAIEGALSVAWTWTTKGTIEGEPRVWKERVFVCDRMTEKRCVLRVLQLADGKESYAQTFDGADVPLEPAVWGDVVVVRAAHDRLEGIQVGERMFTRRWTRKGSSFGPPLLLGTEVYVRDAESLQRLTYEKPMPVWTVPVRATDGLALRGDHLYTTAEDAQYRNTSCSWPWPARTAA